MPAFIIPPFDPFALGRLVPATGPRTISRYGNVRSFLSVLGRHLVGALPKVFRCLVLWVGTGSDFPETLALGDELAEPACGFHKSVPARLIDGIAIGNSAST